ncbi:MAG: hypothetical protein FWD01_04520 [Defluviitaleaceae bacterium]|nr:hypothetical protein [Defluviitaleaceae bacterium]
MKIPRIVVSFILITASILLSACGGGSSSLVGRWEAFSVEELGNNSGEYIEFFSDGTGAATGLPFGFTWSARWGRLTMSFFGVGSITVNYDVSDSVLTIRHDFGWGEGATYRRAN